MLEYWPVWLNSPMEVGLGLLTVVAALASLIWGIARITHTKKDDYWAEKADSWVFRFYHWLGKIAMKFRRRK